MSEIIQPVALRWNDDSYSLEGFHTFRTAQQFEPMSEIIQLVALRGIDDANSLEGNIQRLRNFFNFGPVSQENRRPQPQRIELASCLQHAGFRPFRKHNPLG